VFTSSLWKELFRLTKVQLCMGSAYHPQSDGQTKRVNQCLETFLRCFVNACPKRWLDWLPLAEYWYNTSYHSAIQRSPFKAMYGHSPSHFGLTLDQFCPVGTLDQWLQQRQVVIALIKQ
jgi:hypothetical protein